MMEIKLLLTSFMVNSFNVFCTWCVVLQQTPEFHYNTVLQGSAFTSIWKLSLHECVTECGRRNTCTSGNYFRLLQLCQLNFWSTTNVTLTDQSAVVFFEMSDNVKEDIVRRFCGNLTCDNGRRCGVDINKTQHCQVQECVDNSRTRVIAVDDESVNYVGARRLVDCGTIGNESAGALRNVTTVISTCRLDGTWSLPAVCPFTLTDNPTTTTSLPSTASETAVTTTEEPIVKLTTTTTSATTSSTTSSTTSTTTAANVVCDDGWELYGTHCYFFPNDKTNTWTDAKSTVSLPVKKGVYNRINVEDGRSLLLLDDDDCANQTFEQTERSCRSYTSNLVSFDDEAQFRFVEEFIIDTHAVEMTKPGTVTYWTSGTFYDVNEWFWEPRNQSNARPIDYFHWLDMFNPANNDPNNIWKCIALEQYVDENSNMMTMPEWYYTSVFCDSDTERNLICQKKARRETTPISQTLSTNARTQTSTVPTTTRQDPTTTTTTNVPDVTDRETPRTTSIIPQQDSCEEEWAIFDDHCYHKSHEISNSWTGALDVCERLESDLVSFNDDSEFQFLQDLIFNGQMPGEDSSSEIETSYWIGGRYYEGIGWLWMPRDESKSREITYFKWKNGDSSVIQDIDEKCLALEQTVQLLATSSSSELFYSKVLCDDSVERHIICQKRSRDQIGRASSTTSSIFSPKTTNENTPTPTAIQSTASTSTTTDQTSQVPCGQDGERFGDQCFYFILERALVWKDSQRLCTNFGAQMASIHSDEQFDFLSTGMNTHTQDASVSFWVGGIFHNDQWQWYSDGRFEPILYFRWRTPDGDNNANSNHCLALSRDGDGSPTWYYHSVHCEADVWNEKFVICQIAESDVN